MSNYAAPAKVSSPPGAGRGSWEARKSLLKQKFPLLTDQDLILTAKNREAMVQNLLAKLDKTEEELHAIIISL